MSNIATAAATARVYGSICSWFVTLKKSSTKYLPPQYIENNLGQTRLAKYTDECLSIEERRALESEVVRKCLTRTDKQCSFVEHREYKVIYRRYASLFFLVGVDDEENPLCILEFIHCLVETLDRQFGNVCELDIMFHIETAHYIVDEMIVNGYMVDTNKNNILAPIHALEKSVTQ